MKAVENTTKQLWMKLALVFTFTAAIFVSARQDFVQAQRPEPSTDSTSTFQLHHVTLSVSNIDQVSQWYVELGSLISLS